MMNVIPSFPAAAFSSRRISHSVPHFFGPTGIHFGNNDKFEWRTPSSERAPGEIDILTLEHEISAVLSKTIRAFWKFCPNRPENKQARAEFVQAIHFCQSALASTRFFHSINQDYGRKHNTREPMTSPEKLEELKQWGERFRNGLSGRQTNMEARQMMTSLCDAYGGLMELTRQFPNQHQYDDFQTGMQLVDELLFHLAQRTEPNTPNS